jgi:hypothetical protein
MTIALQRTDRRALRLSVDAAGAGQLSRAMIEARTVGAGVVTVTLDDRALVASRRDLPCRMLCAEGHDGTIALDEHRTTLCVRLPLDDIDYGIDCLAKALALGGFEVAEFCRVMTGRRRETDDVFWAMVVTGEDASVSVPPRS